MKHKIAYWLSFIVIVLAAILLGYLYYLSFWPIEIVRLKKFEVTSPIVQRGEVISYDIKFEKLYQVKPKIGYFLVDGFVLQIADGGIMRNVGKNEIYSYKHIPVNMLPGIYKLRIELEYPVVAWRTITYVWESNFFEVK